MILYNNNINKTKKKYENTCIYGIKFLPLQTIKQMYHLKTKTDMETTFIYLVEVTTNFDGDKRFKAIPCTNKETAKKVAQKHLKSYIKLGKFTEIDNRPNMYYASDVYIENYVSVQIKRKKLL